MKLRLTRDQRRQFFAERYPRIAGEGICPVKVGYVYRLSARLSFKVTMIRKPRKGGWSLEYIVYDQRKDADRYLRPVSAPISLDDKGRPLPMSKNEELGYTSNPKSRLAEHAPSVPADYQNVLTQRAHQIWEVMNAEEILKQQARARAERLRQAEIELRRAGGSPEHYVQAIEGAIDAMRQAARGTQIAA